MSKFQDFASMAAMAGMTLLLAASSVVAQEARHSKTRTPAGTAVELSAVAQPPKRSNFSKANNPSEADNPQHRLILQVNTNDGAAINLALNNAANVVQFYKDLGERVEIEVITFGPGLHMLRDDTSPVKARIEVMALSMPEVSFKACGNTQENMHKAESKDIPIIPQAQVVTSGVVRVMQLEEQGWTYVKP